MTATQLKRSFFTIVILVLAILFFIQCSKKAAEEAGVFTKNSVSSNQYGLTAKVPKGQTGNATNLSPQVINGVKNFVFFVGYERSGHSIIGALLDAHPHVVIAYEFYLFSRFQSLNRVPDKSWKRNLFDLLYKKSMADAKDELAQSYKGYTLEVKELWQGKFDEYIEVMGDKCGGRTSMEYLRDKNAVKRNYKKLKESLSMPMRIFHAVRNPFDIISTLVYYAVAPVQYKQIKLTSSSAVQKLRASRNMMTKKIDWFFQEVGAVVEMIDEVFGRENVLEVHNWDLVSNPRKILSRIFQFIEVDTSEQFLDACAAKVFKSVSRSRDTIEWSPELVKEVEEKMRKYEMFNRYSFNSDQ